MQRPSTSRRVNWDDGVQFSLWSFKCARLGGRARQAGVDLRRSEGIHRHVARGGDGHVSGGENPRIDGDVAGCEWSAFCGESAVVLATVKDARRRFAVAFGHP